MKKRLFFFLLYSLFFLVKGLWAQSSYCVVCVHIGESLPSYLEITLAQARLFNQEASIVLIASQNALEGFNNRYNITLIDYESLTITSEHEKFRARTRLNDQILEGYWRYTSERFLYLYDYMVAFGITNLFHIENDVLIYSDLGKWLPVFQENYPGIATTFESEFKCIPGFVFISNQVAMQKLANYFAIKAHKAQVDMKVMALFWKEYPEDIGCLPMIMDSYWTDNAPVNFLKKKQRHSYCFESFGSIFDGAAIGIFFDGLDPAKGVFDSSYFTNRLFEPLLLDFYWLKDEEGRKVPFVSYKGESYPINNLHIASKRLELFTSKKWPW